MSCACGPAWAPNWLVHKFLNVPEGEQCFFHEACLQHDEDYRIGKPKGHSDDKFLLYMMRLTVDRNPTAKQVRRALTYYRLVKWFGWASYGLARLKDRGN